MTTDTDDKTVIIEKRAYPISVFEPDNTSAIFEVARDSWPKLVATETVPHRTDGDAVIYRGPADTRLYDAEDIELMHESDTVTVVGEVES
jgi:hypothetical protein